MILENTNMNITTWKKVRLLSIGIPVPPNPRIANVAATPSNGAVKQTIIQLVLLFTDSGYAPANRSHIGENVFYQKAEWP